MEWGNQPIRRKGRCPQESIRTGSKNQATALSAGNAGEQVMNGFSLASDWLKEWREFSGPITR